MRGRYIPIARTAICFNLRLLSIVSAETGVVVVMTTSASLILSPIVSVSKGVEGYSVYVWFKVAGKVRFGEWMPSKRTMCMGVEASILIY